MKYRILFGALLLSFTLWVKSASPIDENAKIIVPLCLKLEVSIDSLNKNKLLLVLTFKNNSNDMVSFYPNAPTYLEKPFKGFGINSYINLDSVVDLTIKIKLKKGLEYKKTYTLDIDYNFFNSGNNQIWLCYRIKKTKFICNDVFIGKLNSNIVEFELGNVR